MKLLAIAFVLLLGAGFPRIALAQGSDAFDGQYIGELTLMSVVQGDCTKPPLGSVYPLTISRGRVTFQYTPRFSTTLIGTVDKNGVFKASARAHKGIVRMTGRIRGGSVTATVISPSCNYNFQTKR
jgi:hypothetical protein